MIIPALTAILLSFFVYLGIGLYHRKGINNLGDIIPIIKGGKAKVENSKEFSSTTTATTISLATVIIAFFELVQNLGWWLLWPAITTAMGLAFFSFLAPKIWEKLKKYEHRPSMHEFLGSEFNSKSVAIIGALATSLGYLSMFALELTVGSRFIASLVSEIPEFVAIGSIVFVSFAYLSLGGFKTVVVTDRIGMAFIWIMLFSLIGYYMFYTTTVTFSVALSHLPPNMKTIQWSSMLIPFISGILVMNLFTYVSNMGLWQRIAGSQEPETVVGGMWSSVWQSLISWSLFVIVAIGAFIIVTPQPNENVLITLLKAISDNTYGKITIFFVTLGLLGAQLSTASTQLIAVVHTIYEDIISPYRGIELTSRVESVKEVSFARYILVVSAILAVITVEILRVIGFSVADMAFAIYGSALALVPAVLFALFSNPLILNKIKKWASVSIIIGFMFGWLTAFYGKVFGEANVVFLSPCISLASSTIVVTLGYIYHNGFSLTEKN